MRTTLQLDEDIYRAAKSLSESENRSLGEVVSSLARRGLAPVRPVSERNGLPIFVVPPDARPVTTEMLKAALDDEMVEPDGRAPRR
ncbi:MAG TPA: antitoxin [Thermoanaerobaculia bacterium]|nr:antitoxin [Thermoanaerobaculia bacterium]